MSKRLSEDIIDQHVKGRGNLINSKQFDVPVTTVANLKMFNVHGSEANLAGHGPRGKSTAD